jgi:hypothetical protein
MDMGNLLERFGTKKVSESKIVNERQFVLSEFLVKLNAERKGTKWKPLTGKQVALLTSHLDLQDLRFFYKMCERSQSFGKVFFGALKKK